MLSIFRNSLESVVVLPLDTSMTMKFNDQVLVLCPIAPICSLSGGYLDRL
jgi:hypothetical protein